MLAALLKMLDDVHAPDYAFGRILGWTRGAHAAGFLFTPQAGYHDQNKLIVCMT